VIEIRSYRRVFDLERRIYRIDRLRLNPGGVPVRGVVYFLALVSLGLLASSLPLVGALVKGLPWYLLELVLPAASAALLSVIRIEGRPFHLAAHALLRYRWGPRHLTGARRCGGPVGLWRAEEIVMLPDGSDSSLRELRYRGPGAVLVAVEHERSGRLDERDATGVARVGARRVLTMRARGAARAPSRGEVISLGPGARLRVRSRAARRE
jgi:hypothetical protein